MVDPGVNGGLLPDGIGLLGAWTWRQARKDI
jgi:hypothetical protein